MRAYFILIPCFLSATAYAQQQDTGYYKLIYSEIRRIQDSGMIYYSDRPGKEVYTRFLKQIPGALKTLKERGLDLSKQEEDTVVKQLKVMTHSMQSGDLFPLSKRISSDTIVSFVENEVRITVDSLRVLSGASFTADYHWRLPWAFFFANPIYLRNRTICFSYFMYYRNNAGEEGLRVYKIQNGEWVKFATIGGGAW
jgi:hypothetical protein